MNLGTDMKLNEFIWEQKFADFWIEIEREPLQAKLTFRNSCNRIFSYAIDGEEISHGSKILATATISNSRLVLTDIS